MESLEKDYLHFYTYLHFQWNTLHVDQANRPGTDEPSAQYNAGMKINPDERDLGLADPDDFFFQIF